jgi:hypothetical protein
VFQLFLDHDFRDFFSHLLIGLIVLIGGGFLLFVHPESKTEAYAAMTFVLGFFFRGNGKSNGNGVTKS